MSRAGGWILGLVILVGMAAAGLIGLRPVLCQKSVTIEFADPTGWTPGQESAVRLAFSENEHRAGSVRVEPAFLVGTSAADTRRLRIQHRGPYWTVIGPLYPPSSPPQLNLPPDDAELGFRAARWVRRSGIRRVYLLNSGDFETAFEKGAIAAGMECIPWEPELRIAEVVAARPELVVLSYPVAPAMVDALRLSGYSGKFLRHVEEQQLPLSTESAKVLEGVYIAAAFPAVPPDFVARLQASPGVPVGPTEYYGYLTARLVLDAVRQADTDDEAAIYQALASSLDFASDGSSTLPGALYVVKNGALQFVEPLR